MTPAATRNAAILVAAIEVTSALVGGGPRPFLTTSNRPWISSAELDWISSAEPGWISSAELDWISSVGLSHVPKADGAAEVAAARCVHDPLPPR